jgi:hypothetical protein
VRCELCGEGAGLFGLRAVVSGGVEREADDEGRDIVTANEAGDGAQVGARSGAVQREQRLRGEAEFVGDCDADAPAADIECERAGHGVECMLRPGAEPIGWQVRMWLVAGEYRGFSTAQDGEACPASVEMTRVWLANGCGGGWAS